MTSQARKIMRECPSCKYANPRCCAWPVNCYAILCPSCRMQGPTADSEAAAIALWDALPRVGGQKAPTKKDVLYAFCDLPIMAKEEIAREIVKLVPVPTSLKRWTAADGTPPNGEYFALIKGHICLVWFFPDSNYFYHMSKGLDPQIRGSRKKENIWNYTNELYSPDGAEGGDA